MPHRRNVGGWSALYELCKVFVYGFENNFVVYQIFHLEHKSFFLYGFFQ